MNKNSQNLLSPYTFANGIELKNRIIMAPMTNFSSNPDGTVTEAEVNYYARRSKGVSMVITACTYVTPNGKGFHGEFGGDSDEMIPSLKQLAKGIKDQGAKAVLQMFHGGRMCPPELVPGKEDEIVTQIDKSKQEQLVIPDPLWNAIIHTPGWFPGI